MTIPIQSSMSVGPYKGYHGRAVYDSDDGEYSGRVDDLRDVVSFVGSNPSEVYQSFCESIDAYLDFCKSRGESPDKPYSGNYPLRMPPTLHRALAVAASRLNKSFNQYLVDVLGEATMAASATASTAMAEPIADRADNTISSISYTARATTSTARHPTPVLLPFTG